MNAYSAAQNFRIRVGRFAEEAFIERADREKRRIHAVDDCGEGDEFVAAEVEFDGDGLAAEGVYCLLYRAYRYACFNHIIIFDRFAKIMQKIMRRTP